MWYSFVLLRMVWGVLSLPSFCTFVLESTHYCLKNRTNMPVSAWPNWSGGWDEVAKHDAGVNLGTCHLSALDSLNYCQSTIHDNTKLLSLWGPSELPLNHGSSHSMALTKVLFSLSWGEWDFVHYELFSWLISSDILICLAYSSSQSVSGKTKLKPFLWVLNRAGPKSSWSGQLLPCCRGGLCVQKYHTSQHLSHQCNSVTSPKGSVP